MVYNIYIVHVYFKEYITYIHVYNIHVSKLLLETSTMGEPEDLARDVSSWSSWSPEMESLVYDEVYILLETQLVKVTCNDLLFQCRRGSGIALLHSAVITNAPYLFAVELSLLSKLKQFRVVLYCRCEDDLIIIGETRPQLSHFCRELLRNGSYLKGSVRSFPADSAQILDINIAIRNGRVVLEPSPEKIPRTLCFHQLIACIPGCHGLAAP